MQKYIRRSKKVKVKVRDVVMAMARLSDLIENFIKELMEEAGKHYVEIQRNELANVFNCAPSQINYVLETRFTIDRGYIIESKRGGGGYIKIYKTSISNNWINKIIENIGDNISESKARYYIDALLDHNIITSREAALMKAVVNDKILPFSQEDKNMLRALLLKAMLMEIARNK
ncbi:transcriptional regulator CtsR [Thermoanaerobacter thermohydrosulfuricus]|uniref:Transcriptional regulator CtsR n=2 Tax=Thermoanaerobacter TaxID=1754 RepID=G2MX14_9THEO|nr:transcriptional repressor, CtsR [Thermoanaerobacter wiegelii Rt8.B1]EGD51281.1 transcriptional repressor, CtsR [Thermoanaerobacter ethanolicus JW 200]SDG64190.1 transcriptional regulator CtsR [Thermoanaerobacter thermohydrosulfuricus]